MSTILTTPPTVLETSAQIVSSQSRIYSPPYMSFIFLMLLLIGIFFALEYVSSAAQTSNNWPQVRCQPQNMLLAGLYGHDANENFQYCLQQIIQGSTKGATAPFAQGMGGFTSVLQNLMSSANSFRTTLATMAGGIIKIISEFKSRMTALMGRVKLTASRMKAMMYRVYGTMFAVMYMGISAQTGISNFGDTFIFKFIDTFCFAPDTRVIMADGSDRNIMDLRLGDKLAGDKLAGDKLAGASLVEAIIECPGSSEMYNIYGVKVSGRHRIWSSEQNKFICVKDHPDAIYTLPEPKLWTLITSNREIPVKGSKGPLRFADWEEIPSTDKALKEWDSIVQVILNNKVEERPVPKSAPCLDKAILVYKYQAGFTPLFSIKVGDWILDSYTWTKVVGVCQRRVQTSIGPYGKRITDGLWVKKDSWTHPSGKINKGVWNGCQLITSSGTFTIYNDQIKYHVRDFTEVGTDRLAESFRMEDDITRG